MVQRVEQVDAFDGTTTAMVKVPAHQLALIGPGFLLNRVIKDQHPIVTLDAAHGSLHLLPQVFRGVFLC